MKIQLYKVNPISGGEETELYFELSSGENTERTKFTVSAEMFFELGFSSVYAQETDVSAQTYDYVVFLAEKHAAVKKGINILSFGDNTKKGLSLKLRAKGFSRDAAEEACEYLASAGYINEAKNAELLARDMAEKRLYGAKRISAALYEKGFDKEVIREAIDSLDVNFSELCLVRINRMGGKALFASPETKQKALAALVRYGFSYEDIRGALSNRNRNMK